MWQMSRRRNCFEWKKVQLQQFMNQIQVCTIQKGIEDEGIWNGNKDGDYTVKLSYKRVKIDEVGVEDNVFAKL